jgi:hypothetical protein
VSSPEARLDPEKGSLRDAGARQKQGTAWTPGPSSAAFTAGALFGPADEGQCARDSKKEGYGQRERLSGQVFQASENAFVNLLRPADFIEFHWRASRGSRGS